jgi:hypothetical protein
MIHNFDFLLIQLSVTLPQEYFSKTLREIGVGSLKEAKEQFFNAVMITNNKSLIHFCFI